MDGSMTDTTRRRYQELIQTLNYHSRLYYTLDSPEISDYEYDQLMQELKRLEAENPQDISPDSPTQRIGDEGLFNTFEKVEHRVPMGSLQDVFSEEELFDFGKRCKEAVPDALLWWNRKLTAFLFPWNTGTAFFSGAPPGAMGK